MTYAELKAELEKLTLDQLAREVVWWGDSRGGTVKRCAVLEEDWCCIDEGCEPVSVYKDDPEAYAEAQGSVVHRAGAMILEVDE